MNIINNANALIFEDGVEIFQTNEVGSNMITFGVNEAIQLAQEILKQYNIKTN